MKSTPSQSECRDFAFGRGFITFCTLLLVCSLAGNAQAQSQWTSPDASNNINSTNTGNVGIGTSTPRAKLEVVGLPPGSGISIKSNDVVLNPGASLFFDGNYLYAGGSYIRPLGANTQGFFTSGTERMRIDANGNVGVGTANPGNKLTVAGAAGDGLLVQSTGSDTNTSNVSITNQSLSITTAGFGYPNTYNANFGNPSPGSGGDSGGVAASFSRSLDNIGGAALVTLYNRNQGGAVQNGLYLNATGASGQQKFFLNAFGGAFFAGNVGIGTTTPQAALHVVGNITVTGNINAKYQDVAEWVPSTKALATATVVVLDSTQSNYVTASLHVYDTKVAGVISERPGIALGESGANKVLVATTGRVKVKADASRTPIHIGDLLVTSSVEGYAMKSMPLSLGGVEIHRPGTLIGKALEPLASGTGEILVLLSLQ